MQQTSFDDCSGIDLEGGVFQLAMDVCLGVDVDGFCDVGASRDMAVGNEAVNGDVADDAALVADNERSRLTAQRADVAPDLTVNADAAAKEDGTRDQRAGADQTGHSLVGLPLVALVFWGSQKDSPAAT